MKLKSIFIILFASTFFSCGSKKASANMDEHINATNAYASKVDNGALISESMEGALTDADGFRDIGTFKQTVYFDGNNKQLLKINNVEKTTQTIDETYYYKEGNLVLISLLGPDIKSRMIYVKGSKAIHPTGAVDGREKILIEKGKRLRKEVLKNN